MNQKKNRKKGFSLPEVIIALTLVVLVIVSATDLLVSSNRANNLSIKNVIAYNLAQEALEGMRNIRDGYWLHNRNWKGEDGIFGDDFKGDGYFIIEKADRGDLFNYPRCITGEKIELNEISQYAPWQLEKLNTVKPFEDNKTIIYKQSNLNSFKYTHKSTQNEETNYRRWIEINAIDYTMPDGTISPDFKIGVTAVVAWEEKGLIRNVRIPTILTNWKDGPL